MARRAAAAGRRCRRASRPVGPRALTVRSAGPGRPLRRSEASISTCSRTRSSASSANPDRARASPRSRSPGSCRTTPRVEGSVRLGGTRWSRADAERLRPLRGEDVGFIFQDPTTTLNPVLPVGRQIIEGQVAHGRSPAPAGAARARWSCCARWTSPIRPVAPPVSAPVLRRHAAAGGHRHGDGGPPAAHHRRRADDGPRRHRAGAGARVLARRQARDRGGGDPDHPRSRRGRRSRPSGRGDVCRPHRRTGPVDAIFRQPRHPYTVALLQSMPRIEGARRGSIRSLASRRRRRACRRAAPSSRAARRARPSALPQEDPALRAVARRPGGRLPFRGGAGAGAAAGSQRRRASRRAAAGARRCCGRRPAGPLPRPRRLLRRTVGPVRAVDGVSLPCTRARPGPGRRIRLRQDHDRAAPSWAW